MKTSMQELIERLERNIKEMPNEVNRFTQGYKAGLNFVIECATTSLEKEKEQIITDYSNGLLYALGYKHQDKNIDYGVTMQSKAEADIYYNQTYNQNK